MGTATLESLPLGSSDAVSRDRFLDGMRLSAATVSVVTTESGSERFGATVSAMCSVTADPPSLLVCIDSRGRTAMAISRNGVFCANLLAEPQRPIAEAFAGIARADGGPFALGRWRTMATGAPVLVDAVAAFDCRVSREVRHGTHTVFFGTVVDVDVGSGMPLVYADKNFRRVTPISSER